MDNYSWPLRLGAKYIDNYSWPLRLGAKYTDNYSWPLRLGAKYTDNYSWPQSSERNILSEAECTEAPRSTPDGSGAKSDTFEEKLKKKTASFGGHFF